MYSFFKLLLFRQILVHSYQIHGILVLALKSYEKKYNYFLLKIVNATILLKPFPIKEVITVFRVPEDRLYKCYDTRHFINQ